MRKKSCEVEREFYRASIGATSKKSRALRDWIASGKSVPASHGRKKMRSLPRGPVLSAVGEGREGKQAARGWAGRERVGRARGGGEVKAGPFGHQGAFSFFFLFLISFMFCFPKVFFKRILTEKNANQKQSSQNKICFSMNA